MKTGQKVLANTGFLSFGQVVVIATGVVWTAIIARYIDPVVYDNYGYLQSILVILLFLSILGLKILLPVMWRSVPSWDGHTYSPF